jgi:hypothetical protein
LAATSRTGIVGGGLGFTLCAWVYRTPDRSNDRVIEFGNGMLGDTISVSFGEQSHSAFGRMGYWVRHGILNDPDLKYGGVYASNLSFPANVWTHVAVVQSRASLADTYGPAQIYWNGVSVATTASMRFISVAPVEYCVGALPAASEPLQPVRGHGYVHGPDEGPAGVGRRPQPGAAGWRAARRRPAEHDSAAHLADALVVRGSAATTATAAAVATVAAAALAAAALAALTAVATAVSSYGGDCVSEQHRRPD